MGRAPLVLAALLLSGCAHSVGVVATVPSPDGRHVATAYSEAGHGWLGYCYVCVRVRKAGEPSKEAAPCRGNRQRVPCHSGLRLKWQGTREVWLGFFGEPREGAPMRQAAAGAGEVETLITPLRPQAD